ncbi:hypothetical protein LCGC14_1745790, partial [marine sediment metagenome]
MDTEMKLFDEIVQMYAKCDQPCDAIDIGITLSK